MDEYQATLTGDPKTDLVNVTQYDGDDVQMIDRETQFGNPFRLKEDGGEYTREESVAKYREWFKNKIQDDPDFRESVEELRGETLGCWCKPKACHGDVILEYLRGRMDIETDE